MPFETCGICGGDGRIANAFGGSSVTCPGCHGSGQKADTAAGFHDVTKTKPSHHKVNAPAAEKQKWPATAEGATLAKEVTNSGLVGADAKARLILEIIEHEGTHSRCTETFIKKVRKQIRPRA